MPQRFVLLDNRMNGTAHCASTVVGPSSSSYNYGSKEAVSDSDRLLVQIRVRGSRSKASDSIGLLVGMSDATPAPLAINALMSYRSCYHAQPSVSHRLAGILDGLRSPPQGLQSLDIGAGMSPVDS